MILIKMKNYIAQSGGCMSGAEKTFVKDTNVFIHKGDAMLSFKENEVVVPLWVLEELDKFKKGNDIKNDSLETEAK